MKKYTIWVCWIVSLFLSESMLNAQQLSVNITSPDDDWVVPDEGVELVATATPASGSSSSCLTFDWTDQDGGDWGTGTVIGNQSTLMYNPPGYTYGTDQDMTCTVTDKSRKSDVDELEVCVPLITTLAYFPCTQSSSRTTIGIGEEVNIQISPTDVPQPDQTFWSNDNLGQFEGNIYSGLYINYQAYWLAGTDTIFITFANGTVNSDTQFTILTPTFHLPQNTVEPLYPVPPSNYGVSMDTTPYFGPDEVNFYNAWWQEEDAPNDTTGSFDSMPTEGHNPGSAISLGMGVTPGWGNGNNGVYDQDMFSIYLSLRPYQDGSKETINIPEDWNWSDDFDGNGSGGTSASGVRGTITTAVASATLSVTGANAVMSESKFTDNAQATAAAIINHN